MSREKDLQPISEGVDELFRRLGISNPEVMAVMTSEWDGLAGAPWSGRSQPLYLRGTTLVVEAFSGSMVAFLRYGESALLESLGGRFGPGIVEHVDVRPPTTR